MRDVYNFRIVEAYNEKKFEGIIDVNSNIGDEIALKNPAYDKVKRPELPPKLFFYPIKKKLINYILSSKDIDSLPIKILQTTKISVGNRAYERIDDAASVKITAEKKSSYRDYINGYMDYAHMCPLEWKVWKIIVERAVADKLFVRAISFPTWGKTSTFYVTSLLRNDIEILDNNSYAKLKYSLSVKPKVLVLDECDDIDTDSKRSLSKVFRNCGDGRGKISNDTRATGGTQEVFNLEDTSIVALYNFPKDIGDKFFDNNFHPKILSRLFPILLNGGDHDKSPLIHKHSKELKTVSEEEKEVLNNTLKNSRYYEESWSDELGEKVLWMCKNTLNDTRWSQTYNTICNGLRLYANTIEEFHELEDVLFTMHKNYLDYAYRYSMGNVVWNKSVIKGNKDTKQVTL